MTARTSEAPVNADCAACHNYPVGGVNHQFHLLHADSLRRGNGPITCLDCHRSSLKERDAIIHDSVFTDPQGRELSVYDSGSSAAFRDSVAHGRYLFARIDTFVHHRPVPGPATPGRVTFLQEWMTGADHLNGVVDVVFDSNNSDTTRYWGLSAAYNPQEETCSAVACHVHDSPYQWPAPSKGLRGMNVSTTAE